MKESIKNVLITVRLVWDDILFKLFNIYFVFLKKLLTCFKLQFCLQVQIICRLHLPVHLLAYTSLFVYYLMNVSSMQIHSTNCKGSWTTSGWSKWYWARPRVGVLARSWCISQKNQVGFELMLKLLMNLMIFLMVNTFSWGGGIQLLRYRLMTNISLLFTCSFLVALSYPSNILNFTTAPPPTSSNKLHKY